MKLFRFACFVYLIFSLTLFSCRTALNGKTEYEREWEFERNEKESKKADLNREELKSLTKNILLKEEVQSWLGVPYKYGGTTRAGIDCSAFCGYVYKKVYGITLNRSAHDIFLQTEAVKKNELREGDLVFFKIQSDRVSHVGIYLRDDRFVHASTSRGVTISSLNETYWQKYFHAGGRVKRG
jgi:lipoprotein Spr